MKRVTVIGLGIIGGTWAKNLHDDGLEVRGWNRTPKDLPFFEPDLVRAVADAEMIIIVVADPLAVENVLETILPHLKPGQIVAQSSTISPHWTKLFAQKVMGTGAMFLEAPFTGSRPAAESRQTVFYLGGAADEVEMTRCVLKRLSAHILHVGPLGTASSLKLAMNLNIALVFEALAESLVLARMEGIPDDIYFKALRLNVARSGVSDLKEPKLRTADFSPQFSLKHMAKDLRLALETAGDLHLPVAERLKSLYDKGIDLGWGDDDFSGLFRLLADPSPRHK